MRANRAYELKVARRRGVDCIEVLEIDSGEIALLWDLLPSQTGRMARALRADLAQLEADAFLAKWERWQAE
jgi:hypothetical protein